MNSPEDVLQGIFGFDDFRPGQKEIIDHLMAGQSTLAVMPTGAGKSMCFQVPALLSEHLTIIVSPLVALMDDQVAGLRDNGVPAACIHSGLSREDQVAAWLRVKSGDCRLLYLSPERLMTERMLAALAKLTIFMFVIDEAHCISKWGVSFRPEYDQLTRLGGLFPGTTFAAFTATADRATREDIAAKLFRNNGRIIVHGFDRPNLRLGVAEKSNWKAQLSAFLEDKTGQSGIVYCLSRKYTEEVATYLNDKGISALPYHAGLDAQLRKVNQDRFMSEEGTVMVATIAFGMGIDKPDIRYVCHLNLPGSLEAYYQEIGRAGRDGELAETLMLFGLDDIRMRRLFITEDGEDDGHKLREHKRLDALMAYAEATACRRRALLAYFDEMIEPCGNCDNCLNPPTVIDGTTQARLMMAAIIQTGQYFGAGHINDVLRGADNQKIRDKGHNRLTTYGTGKDYSKKYWQGFMRQAVAGGYLSINVEKYGRLEITARGQAVIEDNEAFLFKEISEAPLKSSKPSRSKAVQALSDQDAGVFSDVKALRLKLAKQNNVPAYVVFSDATLIDMVAKRPATREEMLGVSGVGPSKLEKYGDLFLEALSGA
ncbi:MAG: DNA helicase RecQ [Rhodospirillaceae bacterium]|jgi:ATP-dependent DNA helicase RecQ|nr:DNA helicase RecQ [Rhodospirillaceae bacterium]MBT5243426.1 DNA helicase RecQ [Rhodospirillaceae bacterium]MBT5563431.1 DNA helicase RecQ [Rhodospirillaceae bacterium]MBT6241106.1 DNA helicase RecQ [Rhodospirillaceae bacterium]MBT7137617.1 DNA helicase RecQ [Rhodospirillaceae bacterium]